MVAAAAAEEVAVLLAYDSAVAAGAGGDGAAAHSDRDHRQTGRARRADPALTGWRRSSGRQRCEEMRPGRRPGRPRTTQTRERGQKRPGVEPGKEGLGREAEPEKAGCGCFSCSGDGTAWAGAFWGQGVLRWAGGRKHA